MDKLLFQLKMLGTATAAELAERLEVSPQAIREKLARLHDVGMVVHHDKVRGIGRPKKIWELSEVAWKQFPDTHADLTVSLIDAIRASLGEPALERLIAHREAETEARYEKALSVCPTLGDKVAALADLRSREGYMAECRTADDGDGYVLVENHCPICIAARACQGFCRAEQDVFARALGPDCSIERTEHLLSGAHRCAYRIRPG
jgi:predicted ArsR family transcriptional regulator